MHSSYIVSTQIYGVLFSFCIFIVRSFEWYLEIANQFSHPLFGYQPELNCTIGEEV